MSGITPNYAFLANTPALTPPPGEHSNLVHPPMPMLHASIVTYCICLPLVIAAASVRVFTKSYVMKSIQYEDYAIVFASLGIIAYCGLTIDALTTGAGLHQWDISILRSMRLGMLTNIASIVFGPVMFLAKLSVLWPMIRIFSPMETGVLFWYTHALIWANFLFYVTGSLALVFECRPREKIWNPFVTGLCGVNGFALFIASTAFNTLSDLLMLVLPLYSIWHLKMAIKRKVGVSIIFTTGLFAVIASIVRLVYSIPILTSHDTSYIINQVGILTVAELTIIILCGCMPILPRFVKFFMGRNSVNSPPQGYRRAVLLSNNQKKPGNNYSSGWYGADTDTRVLTHSYLPLDEPLAYQHTYQAQDTKPPLVSPEISVREHEVDEEALAGWDRSGGGDITKTILMETRREKRTDGEDGGPVKAPVFWS